MNKEDRGKAKGTALTQTGDGEVSKSIMKEGIIELGSDEGRLVHQQAKVKVGHSPSQSSMSTERRQDQGWGTRRDAVRKSPVWPFTTLDSIPWAMKSPQQILEKITSVVVSERPQSDSRREQLLSPAIF